MTRPRITLDLELGEWDDVSKNHRYWLAADPRGSRPAASIQNFDWAPNDPNIWYWCVQDPRSGEVARCGDATSRSAAKSAADARLAEIVAEMGER